MTIRTEQMESLSQALKDSFVQRMATHLRLEFAADLEKHQIPLNSLEPLIRQSIEEAESYGVVQEDGLQLYLECVAMFGPGFDRNEQWAQEILAQAEVGGDEKMAEINEFLIFGLEEPR